MPITAIISEYNPFHNGHKYLIEKRISHCPDSYFIAVMSGNFTQRGEAAILNKWQRAELAVSNGIDLVLELPFVFAVNSAQYFAQGAINLLKNLNCVDTICFGSEYTDVHKLQSIAEKSLSDDFSFLLKKYMKEGISYAAASTKSLSELTNINENILKEPNTILGLEYLKACKKNNAKFSIDIIERIKAKHNEQTINHKETFASGTAIRNLLYKDNTNFSQLKQVVPQETFNMLISSKNNLPNEENLFLPLISRLRFSKIKDIESIYGINEGIEYKLISAANQSINKADFLNKIKSKRYPLTNLQRILLYLLLDFKKAQFEKFTSQKAVYARVLAFNDKGTHILKQIKKNSSIALINKTSTYLNSKKRCQHQLTTLEEMLSLDTYATELYNLCFNPPCFAGMDFLTTPKYIKI